MAIVFQAEIRQIHQFEDLRKEVNRISKMYRNIVGEIIEQSQKEVCMRKNLYLGLVKHFILEAIEGVSSR